MWYIEIVFYLLKPLIKVFIKAGVLSDLGSTVDYPKKLTLGSIFKTSGATKSAPAWRRRYLITRTRYIDGICLSASMVLLSRCSSVSNMV
mgnify:CR=1 FL=1